MAMIPEVKVPVAFLPVAVKWWVSDDTTGRLPGAKVFDTQGAAQEEADRMLADWDAKHERPKGQRTLSTRLIMRPGYYAAPFLAVEVDGISFHLTSHVVDGFVPVHPDHDSWYE